MVAPHFSAALEGKNEVTPENFTEAMQQAIEIEIATIPVYLYTYYSIIRVPNQDDIRADLTTRLLNTGITQPEAEQKALEMSVQIMVFANKVGAMIVSVAVEEMLHMSLASNVKQALVGPPDLIDKSPSQWPAFLPGHDPPFPINRARYSLDQLHTFLLIESPEPFTEEAIRARAIPYMTIGQFYEQIEKCIKKHYKDAKQYDKKRPQLGPNRGFYAQNNIDSAFYNAEHKPKFVNAEDSGGLIRVVDKKSALAALAEIVEQGEGHKGGSALGPHGEVICDGINLDDFDDKTHQELAHFDKFRLLYCETQAMQHAFSGILDDPDFDPRRYYVIDVPDNPSTADYPEAIQAVSNLTNAVYSYLFLLTEACYRQGGNAQFEIFMFGIHKGMLWILSSLCGEMTGMVYIAADGKQYNAAPTFENYPFSAASSAKSQIIALYNQAVGYDSSLSYLGPRIHDLPNVPLEEYLEDGKPASILS